MTLKEDILNIFMTDTEIYQEYLRLKSLGFIYNIYGSQDSTDTDVVFYVDKLSAIREDRKRLVSIIKKDFKPDWNITLAIVKDGIITDCIYPKASPESLNNAIFNTYDLHEQDHPCKVLRYVERNTVLAIYKTIRLLCTYLTRTEYRTFIRPTVHWSFSIDLKVNKLLNIKFNELVEFNQPNMVAVDIWKTWCFYVVQNKALLNGLQIYTKADAFRYEPRSYNFIYRKELTKEDKEWFNTYVKTYLYNIKSLGIITKNNVISLNAESADMINELPINKQN